MKIWLSRSKMENLKRYGGTCPLSGCHFCIRSSGADWNNSRVLQKKPECFCNVKKKVIRIF